MLSRLLGLPVLLSGAACGGPLDAAAPDGFARTLPAAAAPAAAGPATAAQYDAGTGLLWLPGVTVATGTGPACYDAQLRTVASAPITLELEAASSAACSPAQSGAGRYDAVTGVLTIARLPVVGVTPPKCYDLSLHRTAGEPLRLELDAATEVACATTTTSSLVLSSPVGTEGGTLPADYTCDGMGSTPALAWSGVPAGTKSFALLMSTLPGDGSTKWNWVLWDIPAAATGLARDAFGVGSAGVGSDGPFVGYQPPCSQGPGPKRYTWTLHALAASPALPGDPAKVSGAVLAQAIAPLTLATASLNLSYSRSASSSGSSENCLHLRNSLAAGFATGQATVSCDASYGYLGGNGLVTHPMMDGITATNLQVPIAQNFFGSNAWKIPLRPAIAAGTTTAVDGPIGVAVNGVPIFNPCKQGGCQNGDTKVLGELDVCNGHAGRADDYHYHAAPICLMATKPANYWDTHPLGWALDGFAIFGYRDASGQTAERDAVCGGNTGAVSNAPGGYSYHVTDASPYVLSCFRGTPSPDLANQGSKYAPLRKPPVTPFAVNGMTLSTDQSDGYQVLQFSTARAFTTTATGNDSYPNPAGSYRIRYLRVTGAELDALLSQAANRGKSACWRFQFGTTAGASTQPATTYCR